MGNADSGHYYSLIKDKNSNWLEFNDNIVRHFDIRDLAQEAFGGEEKVNLGNIGGNISKGVKERNRNAYLLFYQRSTYFDENGIVLNTLQLNENKIDDGKINISSNILNEIKEDNLKYNMKKYIFDKEYSDFVIAILQELNQSENLNSKTKLEAAKFGILFLLTVPLRAKEREKLPIFLKEIKILLIKSYELSQWLVKSFRDIKIIKEYLITCQVKDMKYFVVGLLKIALEVISAKESKLEYSVFLKESKLIKFIDSLIFTIYELKEAQLKTIDKIFDIFMILSSLNNHIKLYLLQNKMIGRIICYINNIKPPMTYKHYKEYNDPSIHQSKDLGEPTEFSNRKNELIKSMGDILEKKKEKLQLDNISVNFNSLIISLGQLVTVLQLTSPPSDKFLPFTLDEDEHKLLYLHPNLLDYIATESTSKKARMFCSNVFAHLATGNLQISQSILSIVEKELDNKDEQQLKIFLQILEKLLLIQDKYQQERVNN